MQPFIQPFIHAMCHWMCTQARTQAHACGRRQPVALACQPRGCSEAQVATQQARSLKQCRVGAADLAAAGTLAAQAAADAAVQVSGRQVGGRRQQESGGVPQILCAHEQLPLACS